MSFVKFDTRRVPIRHSLRLNGANLHIGSDAYLEMGSPERIEIYYDAEAKAIKLEAGEHGRKVALNRGRAPHLSIRLSKVMPQGRYDLEGDGIFKLAEEKQA